MSKVFKKASLITLCIMSMAIAAYSQCVQIAGNKVYAGSSLGLFCKSSGTWAPLYTSDSINHFSVNNNEAVTVIFAETGKGNYIISIDGGNTWRTINNISARPGSAYVDSNNVLYVGTSIGSYFGFSRSIDLGITWTTLGANDGLMQISSIFVSNGAIYAVSSYGKPSPNVVFTSSNNGTTWNKLIFDNDPDVWYGIHYIYVFSNFIFLATDNGYYYSPDTGATWLQDPFFTGIELTYCKGDNQYRYCGAGESGLFKATIYSITDKKLFSGTVSAADISDSSIYVFSSDTLYYSNDSGVTWQQENYSGSLVQAVYSFNDIDIIVTLDAGNILAITRDGGNTWQECTLPESISGIYYYPLPTETIYAMTNQALYKSTSGGVTWNNIKTTSCPTVSLTGTGTYVYLLDQNGLNISYDKGTTWTYCQPSTTPPYLSVAVKGPNIYTGDYDYIYGSGDYGKSWKQLYNALTIVFSICATNNNIYANCAGYGIMSSNNGGTNWNKENIPVDFWFLAENKSIAYAYTGNAVYFKKDGDAQWTLSSLAGSSSISVNQNGTAYATHNEHLYKSLDGINWTLIPIVIN